MSRTSTLHVVCRSCPLPYNAFHSLLGPYNLCYTPAEAALPCQCSYEAWVIYNFLSLCLAYVGGPGSVEVRARPPYLTTFRANVALMHSSMFCKRSRHSGLCACLLIAASTQSFRRA